MLRELLHEWKGKGNEKARSKCIFTDRQRQPSTSDETKSESDDETGHKRRNRTSFTAAQLEALESAFKANHYPGVAEREKLALETKLCENKIQVV